MRACFTLAVASGSLASAGCESPTSKAPARAVSQHRAKPLKPAPLVVAKPTPPEATHSDLPGADKLPEAAGKILVLSACTTCHTPDLLASQRLTPEQWAGKVTKMQGWGAIVSPADVETMANYLATNFGPEVPDPELVRVPAPL